MTRTPAADPTTVALARDAAQVFSAAVDAEVVQSVAATMRGLDSVSFVNLTGFREESHWNVAFANSARLASERLAEALGAANAASAARIRETFANVQIGPLIRPDLAETVRSLDPPQSLGRQLSEALIDLPSTAAVDLAPSAGVAVERAVELAFASTAVREIVARSLDEVDDMSSVKRRQLSADALEAIVRLCLVIALLLRDSRIELASALLGVVAIFVVIFWRASGRLDDVTRS